MQQFLATPNLHDFNYHSLQVSNYNGAVEEYPNGNRSSPDQDSSLSGSGDSLEREGDFNDPMLKYLSQMLMEEDDLEHKPCMFHDCSALQAAEKSFYDILTEPKKSIPYVPDQEYAESHCDISNLTRASDGSGSSAEINHFGIPNSISDEAEFDSLFAYDKSTTENVPPPSLQPFTYTNIFLDAAREMDESLMTLVKNSVSSVGNTLDLQSSLLPSENKSSNLDLEVKDKTSSRLTAVEENERKALVTDSIDKKIHSREDDDGEERRSGKQIASCEEERVALEMYDHVLLSPCFNSHLNQEPSSDDALKVETRNKLQQMEKSLGSTKGRPRGKKRSNIKKEVVDLRSMLLQCAEAVATTDSRTTNELLKKIRLHSSANGDGVERLAHYFANALEARLAGTGTAIYASFRTRRSAAELLQGYKMFLTACPFKKVSNIFANRSIGNLAAGATRLHIIDFGILYGFQWPCLIQCLSMRPGGPPTLRITGVDLPQPGFRPTERVEETGNRLAKYCQRFNVPFEYDAIAKKWETIQIEDFKINKDELLVVNCIDRLSDVPDETVIADSPRDKVLNLIRTLQPALFILGVGNGTYNSPFFVTRFREALFHFSARFDMFDATVSRESRERALMEQEVIGRNALNVIACEGTERVDRPETYKQWQVRTVRAGFKQLPLDREILKRIRSKVKMHYHKDFSVDENNCWVLQGWKGRVSHAVSCWVPE